MIYCSRCGGRLQSRIPPGDDRPRFVCTVCSTIHYENPRTVVGCVIEHEGRILLCKRAIEPARGRWTPPAGFLELGEGLQAGALRETWEEARARARIVSPLAFLDLSYIGEVFAFFRAELLHPDFEAGEESLEVELFEPDTIPWNEIAFPVHQFALRLYLEDGTAPRMHMGTLRWSGQGSRFDPDNYALEERLSLPVGHSGPQS